MAQNEPVPPQRLNFRQAHAEHRDWTVLLESWQREVEISQEENRAARSEVQTMLSVLDRLAADLQTQLEALRSIEREIAAHEEVMRAYEKDEVGPELPLATLESHQRLREQIEERRRKGDEYQQDHQVVLELLSRLRRGMAELREHPTA